MQWNSVSEFVAMGGYGLYVWGSFGATALVIALEVFLLGQRRKALLQELREERHAEPQPESTP